MKWGSLSGTPKFKKAKHKEAKIPNPTKLKNPIQESIKIESLTHPHIKYTKSSRPITSKPKRAQNLGDKTSLKLPRLYLSTNDNPAILAGVVLRNLSKSENLSHRETRSIKDSKGTQE